MPLPDWITNLWDRAVNARVDRDIARQHDMLMKQYGFSVGSLWDELGDHLALAQEVDGLAAAGRHEDIEPLYEQARRADVVLPSGIVLHEALRHRLMPQSVSGQPIAGDLIAPFRAAWERRPTPFTAALYALVLHEAAYAIRGTDTAEHVSPAEWEAMGRYLVDARQVLDETPDAAGDCQLWHRANYDLALDEALDFAEYEARFEAAWALDRFNLPLCENHAIRLLPRWMGRDPHDVEVFARRAVEMTEARFGAGAYAVIHHGQSLMGSLEPEDTLCDPDLIRQGFADMIARFDGQSLLNRQAGVASWLDDQATVHEVFTGPLRTIVTELWTGDDQAEEVEDALDAFLLAKDTI